MLSTAHRYLLSVAETGSIRASSQALNVAASAISRQIQILEHQFGHPLFERFASGMVLTPEGRIVAHHLQRTAREIELAEAEINALHDLVTGTIRFAAIEGVLASWLIPAMSSFRERHPSVQFEGRILGSNSAYELVMADRLDFGIVVWDEEWSGIDIRKSFDTPLLVAMRPDHPLVAERAIPLTALASEPLTLLDDGFTTRLVVDKMFAKSEVAKNVALDVNHIEIAKRYVQATGGVTILPEYAVSVEVAEGTLVSRPLAHARAVLKTVLFTRSRSTHIRATECFLDRLVTDAIVS
ncbi:LysR family transcriptional regulator [Roseovarius sp. CAU 1744]|uniref:LysR family transcriptional regulator n=1 Tax=Roseovarius sp. CAU 1744 TaxID=3140368 RepID=UPI00325B109C